MTQQRRILHKTVAQRVLAAIVATSLIACTTVGPSRSPQKDITVREPRTVWLTRTNGSVIRVDGPRMIGDTVIGAVEGQYAEVPLSQVTRVAAVEPAPGKTIAAAALGGAVTVAVLVEIFSHSGSGSNSVIDSIADSMTLGRQR